MSGLTKQLKRVYYPNYTYTASEEKAAPKYYKTKTNPSTLAKRKGKSLGDNLQCSLILKQTYQLNPMIFEARDKPSIETVSGTLLPRNATVKDRNTLKRLLNLKCQFFRLTWTRLNKENLRPYGIEIPVGCDDCGKNPICTGVDVVCLNSLNEHVIIELKTTSKTIENLKSLPSTGTMCQVPFQKAPNSPLHQYFLQLLTTYTFYTRTYPTHRTAIPLLMIITKTTTFIYPLTEWPYTQDQRTIISHGQEVIRQLQS